MQRRALRQFVVAGGRWNQVPAPPDSTPAWNENPRIAGLDSWAIRGSRTHRAATPTSGGARDPPSERSSTSCRTWPARLGELAVRGRATDRTSSNAVRCSANARTTEPGRSRLTAARNRQRVSRRGGIRGAAARMCRRPALHMRRRRGVHSTQPPRRVPARRDCRYERSQHECGLASECVRLRLHLAACRLRFARRRQDLYHGQALSVSPPTCRIRRELVDS